MRQLLIGPTYPMMGKIKKLLLRVMSLSQGMMNVRLDAMALIIYRRKLYKIYLSRLRLPLLIAHSFFCLAGLFLPGEPVLGEFIYK